MEGRICETETSRVCNERVTESKFDKFSVLVTTLSASIDGDNVVTKTENLKLRNYT